MRLALTYAAFAALATLANIGAQDLFVRGYHGPYAVMLSIIAGTGTGLLLKYALDKRYIFAFRARDYAHDSQTFMLYSLMGVVTTLVFWGFELGFDYAFGSKAMRYTGGVIGLGAGYLMKYHLDKRFVFGGAAR